MRRCAPPGDGVRAPAVSPREDGRRTGGGRLPEQHGRLHLGDIAHQEQGCPVGPAAVHGDGWYLHRLLHVLWECLPARVKYGVEAAVRHNGAHVCRLDRVLHETAGISEVVYEPWRPACRHRRAAQA